MNKEHHIFFLDFSIFNWCCICLDMFVSNFLINDKGFDNLLDSMINFTSIIIGFYSAFYGILITIKDTSFMKNIRGSAIEKN